MTLITFRLAGSAMPTAWEHRNSPKCPLRCNTHTCRFWCLMAAPLIYSGDMSKLDKFTLNVLCNPYVIEVNQDPLGECGLVFKRPDGNFIMVKNLADGSKAVGLFNRGKTEIELTVDWDELQIKGKQEVRELWRQKELGTYEQKFSAFVPISGSCDVKNRKRLKGLFRFLTSNALPEDNSPAGTFCRWW